ncbi:glutamate synthase-related protein [Miltoncostaea oceani]|uniref:glutamate synthase-related protein n=1 Tax=Miltoncostaea oceani TaxID=2843216 RepID=UPI001C3CC32A|nr:glutamate synthase-related protein [Miltoncostaea oceani]
MTVPPPFATTPPSGLPDLIEHDACALAAFATRDGKPSRAMLEHALTSLQMMVHRSGSVDGEGDGSGLLIDLPRPAWRRRLASEGLDPAAADDRSFTVAHIFFDAPEDVDAQVPSIEAIIREHGFEILWSGEGTIDRGALGPRASETPPIFWQIACLAQPGTPASTNCYRAMVRMERELDCHVASFSANDAVYKVQGQPEVIARFYPEMQEPDFAAARIIAHNRYSTNTYPTFSRVQPFSILGHNGEINTIAQLREQSEQLGLPITRNGSDSQDLNRLLEGLIFEKGLSLLEAVEFAFPPILGEVHRLPAKLQDLYVHYREALGPYAQGPVGLACRAADEMVFAVDAMGLRPLWWIETEDMYVVSSEPGIVPVTDLTRDPAPLAPGEKVALLSGEDGVPRVLDYWEVQREVYQRAKGRGALPTAETRARLAGGLDPVAVEEYPDDDLEAPELPLETLLASAGWIESDKQQLQFHADRGAEPIGSLGWDGPLGPFTPVPMPLSDYLQETVAVVTNPAIDREREVEHFSTRVVLGRRPPIEGVEPEPPQRCELRMPLILGGMRPGAATLSLPEMRRVAVSQGVACMEDVLAAWDWRAARLPLHFPQDGSVRAHLEHLAEAAVAAVADGAELIVLNDLGAGPDERVCDPHLALSAVDKALREARKEDGSSYRRDASLVLQAAGIRNVHDVMVALGFGAQALCPYALMEKAMDGSPEPFAAATHVLEGLQKGMEKVLSTLGIHELRGYGRLVSAIGVSPEVLDLLAIPGFCASEGRGLGLEDLDALAEQGRQIRAGEESPSKVKLPRMYPKVWKALSRVATSERGYDEFAETLDKLETEQPVALRHAVQPQLAAEADRIAPGDVSSKVGEHELPFLISSMSFGSQGEVAFRSYAEAAYQADMLCMNGEGGEIPDMYGKYPKHRGQQIASGRFGVSSLLINSSEWVEIKIGQGAKPGEGGHLPGSKVTQAIAQARNAAVGSDLISPSNNHDLYSIEDLAQLIDELKTANPHAKVIVKVPVVPGIGTIAIGIAKAGADVLTLSGYDGGTGAARQHALRRAGLPCEIGTVLAHHALTEAGIRDRVEIWADGGLRSAADAIKLMCMGANRLGFGTAAMVAIGCTICRGCQLDTCHVGIATQLDEEEAHERGLKRFVPRVFDPSVETLVRYFTEMGTALRTIAGEMGVREVQDLVGQADRLVQVSHHDRLDLSSLLTPVGQRLITSPAGTPRFFRPFHPPPPHRAPEVAAERLSAGAALAVEEEATTAADRNLGTDLAGLIARATTGVHNAWVNGDGGGVSPTNASEEAAREDPSGNNGSGGPDGVQGGDVTGVGARAPGTGNGNGNGNGNGHRPTLVDLAFTKGAAVGSGLAAFTLDGVRVRVFGGAQDGVGKCALGGEIQVLKAQNSRGDWVGGHVGKSFAYGAQRGLFLIQGNADARAGIRLSGADMVLGGEPTDPLDDRLGTLAARANCKGFAFEYMTGGRVLVLGDPGPWLCSGMTGGVVYVRQNADWNLDEAAVRRRLSKAAKVSLAPLEESDVANVTELLGDYLEALREGGQGETAARLQPLLDDPEEHFLAINPVTQQADPNISTE